jgi:hypothetical protein|tara:strand:- start:7 stop:5286 length:5280 start_codon:yes stop_codon:yes gene_type:complete
MFVYKKLKPSDVSITPFEAHKQFSYVSSSAGNNEITFSTAHWTSESKANYSPNTLAGNFLNHRKYFQLDKIFYRDYITDSANLIPDVNYIDQERRLHNKVNILSIPQNQFGSRIKPNSFDLTGSFNNGGAVVEIKDDGEGNIYPTTNTLGITNYPSEKGRLVYIAPVKGFKKADLTTNNKTGLPIVNAPSNFTLDNIHDDSFYLNQVDYKKTTFTDGNTHPGFTSFIDTGTNGSLRLPHNNLYNFSLNDDFNISFYFKLSNAQKVATSGSLSNDKYFIIAKSDTKTIIPNSGEGSSEILSTFISGNLQPLDVPSENKYPFKIYYKNDATNTGSLFFERSNGEATSLVSTPLFEFTEATAGRLIHISAQKSGSELQLWVDGVKTVSGSDINLDESKNIPPTNEANLYVGTRGDVDSYLDGKLSQIMIWDNALSQTQIQNISESITGTPYIGNIFYDEGFVTITHPQYTDILQEYSASSNNITLSPTTGTEDNHDVALFGATQNLFIIKNIGDRIEQPSSSNVISNREFTSETGYHRNFVSFFNEKIINNFNPTQVFGVNSTTLQNGLQSDGFYTFSPQTVTLLDTVTINPINQISQRFDFMTASSFLTTGSLTVQPFVPSGSFISIGPGANSTTNNNNYAFISTSADVVSQNVIVNFASASDKIIINDTLSGSDASLADTSFSTGSVSIGLANLTNFGGEYVNSDIDGIHLKATNVNAGAYYLGALYSISPDTGQHNVYKGASFDFESSIVPFGITDGANFSATSNRIKILRTVPQNSSNPFIIEVTGSIVDFDPLQGDRGPLPAKLSVGIFRDIGGGYGLNKEIITNADITVGGEFRASYAYPDGNDTPAEQVGNQPLINELYKVFVKLKDYDNDPDNTFKFKISTFKITGPNPGTNLFSNHLVLSSSIATKLTASYDIRLNDINVNKPGPVDANLLGLHQDGNGNDLGVRVNIYKSTDQILSPLLSVTNQTLLTSSFFVSASDMDASDFSYQHLTNPSIPETLEIYTFASNATSTGSVAVGISQSFSLSGSFKVTEKSGSNVLTLNTSLGAAYGSSSYEPIIVFNDDSLQGGVATGSISSSLISSINSVSGNTITVADKYFIVESAYNIIGSGSVSASAQFKLKNEISASTTVAIGTSSLFTIDSLLLGSGSGNLGTSFSSSLTTHNPAPRLRVYSGSLLIRTYTGSDGHLQLSQSHLGLITSGTSLGFHLDVIDTASIGIAFTGSQAAVTSSTGEGFSLDQFVIKGITASLSVSTAQNSENTFTAEATHLLFTSSMEEGNGLFPFSNGEITSSITFVDLNNITLGGALFTTESQTALQIASSSAGFPIELVWTMSANSSSIIRFHSSSTPSSNSLENVIKTIGDTNANQGLSFFIEDPLGVTLATSSFINSGSYSGSENFSIPEVTSSIPGTYLLKLKATNSASAPIPVGFSIGINSNLTSSILGGDQVDIFGPGQSSDEGSFASANDGKPNAAINGDLMYISEVSASDVSSVITPSSATIISLLATDAFTKTSAVILTNPHGTSSGAHNLFTTVSQSGELLILPARIDQGTNNVDETGAILEFNLNSGSYSNRLFITGGCHVTASVSKIDYFVASLSQSATSLPIPLLEGNFTYGTNGFDLVTINGTDFTINSPLLLTGSTTVQLNYNSTASHDYTLKFKNTHLIFEHEYQCSVDEEEYNFTQNITVKKNKSISDTDLVNSITSSIDNSQITLFKPYTTTIGLYDNDYNLLAVGKFAQPIKMSEETDTTFVIRYDT